MSFDALYYNRRSRDILEDYDLELYADPNGYPGPSQRSELAVPGLRLLRLHREPRLELRHRHAGRRQARLPGRRVRVPQAVRQQLAGAGVVHLATTPRATPTRTRTPTSRATCIFLDPRAPNQYAHAARPDPAPVQGRRARTRSRSASSSAARSRGTRGPSPAARSSRRAATCRCAFRRRRRSRTPATTNRWLAPDSVGTLENPSWGQVDLRAQYNRPIAGQTSVEFFVDLFNVMN